MAEHSEKLHDGRFGERFDDEVSLKGLGQIAVGIALTCIIAMAVTWVMIRPGAGSVGAADAAAEAALPPGPLLQADPEGEYHEMRREMDALLDGYGWVDEAAGVVHVPIDEAIGMVLERGLGASAPEAAPADVVDEEGEAGE